MLPSIDNQMTDLINHLFQTNEGLSAYLHYYHHFTQNIWQLEHKLDQLQQEQWDVHEHLMSSPHFKQILWPIIQTYHIHSRWSSFHPYANQLLSQHNSTDSPLLWTHLSHHPMISCPPQMSFHHPKMLNLDLPTFPSTLTLFKVNLRSKPQ